MQRHHMAVDHGILEPGFKQLGSRATGADRIDAPAFADVIEWRRAREAGDAVSGRSLTRQAGIANEARHTRGVDDRAAAGAGVV
jgi:hypothetical protein